jgi:hypothetical protein
MTNDTTRDKSHDAILQPNQTVRQVYEEASSTRDMPLLDERIGDAEERSTPLDEIVYGIRSTSERMGAESWQAFYDRTEQLGIAELQRRQSGKRMTAYERMIARLNNPYATRPRQERTD